MARPTIADLAEAAGVGLSTVDRVINGRAPVRRATAERVLRAADEIGFYASGAIRQRLRADKPEHTFGFLLLQENRPLYQVLAQALTTATEGSPLIRGRARIEFFDDLSPDSVAQRIARLARLVDAIGVVAADHPHVAEAIDQAHERGVPVIGLISELTAQSRVGYVGLDNWKVGRTAAWAIANICKAPGKIGILVGSHRYRCQDQNEMGFRSFFRELAPEFQLLEPLISFEEARYAAEISRDLIQRNPDLVGLFVAGGGVRGVMEALRENEAFRRIVTVSLDLTRPTRMGLIEGVLKLVIAHPLERFAETTVRAMAEATDRDREAGAAAHVLPFDIHTAENV
jgi:LacI family transcriptional regulator, galactose operon repressor